MCSNYRPVTLIDRLLTFFGIERARDDPPQDAFPLGLAPFIRLRSEGPVQDADGRIVEDGIFGLLPHFASEVAYGRKTYNARSETVAVLASFRQAWHAGRRCIVPAGVHLRAELGKRQGGAMAHRPGRRRADGHRRHPRGLAPPRWSRDVDLRDTDGQCRRASADAALSSTRRGEADGRDPASRRLCRMAFVRRRRRAEVLPPMARPARCGARAAPAACAGCAGCGKRAHELPSPALGHAREGSSGRLFE